jgi:hypothetical protein
VERLLIVLCTVLGAFAALGQADTAAIAHLRGYTGFHRDELTLLAGYLQGRYGFAELGIGRNQYGHTRHPYDIGYHAGVELRVDRPELWGVKVGAYAGGGSALGVQLIQYIQGADGCTVLRPEIGIGVQKFKWTYAYNLALSRPRLEGISTHMMSLTYALRLKRLPRDDARMGRP